ncbi:MAG: HAD family hydrolase [Bacteroidales bacterium]|nr:HAD family hydrolase [Bacteroidales bacterium]
MKYKNILFDFDGTLADTRQGIIRTVQGTLRQMGLPEAAPEAVSATIGLPLTECFRLATATPANRVEEAAAIYRNIFPSLALDHITIFPHVLETLHQLEQQGVVMAIVSSRHHISLDPLVRQLGIERYIPLSHVYGEDEGLKPKPAPDLALKVLHDLGLSAEETLVVGDTIYDLQMGSAAGCHTCGVTYGNQSRSQLLTAKPTHLVDSFESVCECLNA